MDGSQYRIRILGRSYIGHLMGVTIPVTICSIVKEVRSRLDVNVSSPTQRRLTVGDDITTWELTARWNDFTHPLLSLLLAIE